MARKRNEAKHHALPPYVYIRRGNYIHRPYLGDGKFGKDVKLCPDTALISEVWQRYEAITTPGAPRKTVGWLIDQYLASKQHIAKAPKTRKEYEKNARTLRNSPTKSGALFEQVDAERVTPGAIRKYIDNRAAQVSANREIAFLSICYSWAVERDLMKANPCKEVRRNSEKPRDRYVTDAEYQIIYDMAAPWPLIQCAMEFAYLCRMRLCEVLELKKSNILDSGLLIQRRKGSRGNITLWNDRLRAAVQATNSLPMPNYAQDDAYLIRSQRGDKLTEDGFSTLWQRLMVMAETKGLERFTFHDLKAKGVSDTKGDKQTASGHRSAAMVDTYNRKLAEVDPAGEK